MILRTLFSAALLTSAAFAADFDRSLPVASAVDLYVSTGSGHIHITPGSDSEIHIKAHVYAGWNAGGDTDGRITRIAQNPPIRQQGNEVHVGEANPEDRHLYNNITIDYEITAPKGAAVNLHSGSGDVNVEHLGRFLKADTGSGSIRVSGLNGPADMRTGSGDIELEENGQGEVKATTGSGSIRIRGLAGALTARTGSGDIQADGKLAGPSRLQSGSGSIRIHAGPEAHFDVDASTGSGSIRVASAPDPGQSHHLNVHMNGGGPILEARTGSGDIEIN